jgi:hypothetical protein
MALVLPNVIKMARKEIGALTGLEVGSTLSASKDQSGWSMRVELVEKKSVPDSLDILATYHVSLDEDGLVLDFTRVGMRRRMDVMEAADVESGA